MINAGPPITKVSASCLETLVAVLSFPQSRARMCAAQALRMLVRSDVLHSQIVLWLQVLHNDVHIHMSELNIQPLGGSSRSSSQRKSSQQWNLSASTVCLWKSTRTRTHTHTQAHTHMPLPAHTQQLTQNALSLLVFITYLYLQLYITYIWGDSTIPFTAMSSHLLPLWEFFRKSSTTCLVTWLKGFSAPPLSWYLHYPKSKLTLHNVSVPYVFAELCYVYFFFLLVYLFIMCFDINDVGCLFVCFVTILMCACCVCVAELHRQLVIEGGWLMLTSLMGLGVEWINQRLKTLFGLFHHALGKKVPPLYNYHRTYAMVYLLCLL